MSRYNAGVAITFYCTRCGICMELDAQQAGQAVRCVRCGGLVRTPAAAFAAPVVAAAPAGGSDLPPLASLAATLPLIPGPPVLSYVTAWPWRQARDTYFAEMARRLHELAMSGGDDAGADDGSDAMTNCSYCGSTIAGFLRKCPYCRHALWGV